MKHRYYEAQARLLNLRGKKLFAARNKFKFDINKANFRLRELTKLLERSQEQNENITRMNLQFRSILSNLKQHRKEVANRRKQLKLQAQLIESRVMRGDYKRNATTIGDLQGFHCDFGVVIQDDTIKLDREVGVYRQIPTHIKPKISVLPKTQITSTADEWNSTIEMRIPGYNSQHRDLVVRSPSNQFGDGAPENTNRLSNRLFQPFRSHGIDDVVTTSSNMIASSVVLDLYKQLRSDTMCLYSWELMLPQYKGHINNLKAQVKKLTEEISSLNAQMPIVKKPNPNLVKKPKKRCGTVNPHDPAIPGKQRA